MLDIILRKSRWIEVALGLFFVVSAVAKAMNMEAFAVQVSVYGVVKDPSLVRAAAYFTVTLEAILGAAFLGAIRVRGLSFAAAIGMTLVYSGLIAYGWAFKGLEDCGCFGEYVKMGPGMSLLKNAVLLAALALPWYGLSRVTTAEKAGETAQRVARLAAVGALILVLGIGVYKGQTQTAPTNMAQSVPVSDESRPFQKFQLDIDGTHYDLGEGDYLVALLSATCHHCQDSVPMLNELVLSESGSTVVGLIMGTDEELEEFIMLTEPIFPTQLVEPLDFFEFIDSAPPRLMVVRDGRQEQAWEWQEEAPRAEEILSALQASGA